MKKILLSLGGSIMLFAFMVMPANAATELITNGGFESPNLNTGQWAIYENGAVEGWSATNKIEIQDHAAGDPYEGTQLIELDPYESTSIYQDLTTVNGQKYELKFAWSPRPGIADNRMEVYWNGNLVETYQASGLGNSNTDWTLETLEVIATGTTTRLEFKEVGVSNTYGMYLDAVSVNEKAAALATCPGGTTKNLLETVTVPATSIAGIDSTNSLSAGQKYIFEASGTYKFANWTGYGYADAEYSHRDPAHQPGMDCNSDGWCTNPATDGLDVQIDNAGINWGAFNPEHKYAYLYDGKNAKAHFHIFDDQYNDNYGGIVLDVYQCVDPDQDGDGVNNVDDLCEQTLTEYDSSHENLTEDWGTNRWLVGKYGESDFGWYQNKPLKKGTGTEKVYQQGLDYTHGCDCQQILDKLSDAGLGEFGGHYKFGCSKSIVEDFHNNAEDHDLDGKYFIETVIVPANLMSGINSENPLNSETEYIFDVSGEWQNRGWEKVDAKFTSGDNWSTWFDAPSGGYQNELLDLQIDADFVNWGDYSSEHAYSSSFPGKGQVVNFRVFDGIGEPNPGWYGDNVGNLTVKIYAEL